MNTIQNLFQQAQLAEAAYASFYDAFGNLITTDAQLKAALTNTNTGGSFSQAQATTFATRYQVISQYTASGGLSGSGSGFSATLFLDTTTGEYTFATRGTELGPTDLLGADFGDIVMDGLAMDQIVDMYNYWQSLNTPAGGIYQAAKLETSLTETAALNLLLPGNPLRDAAIAALKASGAILDTTLAGTVVRRVIFDNSNTLLAGTALATGSGALATCPAQLNVTGHSLGGHLADAFTRLFPMVGSNAVTINGAGFPTGSTPGLGGNALSNIQNLFAKPYGGSAFNPAAMTNIHGDGPNFVTMDSQYGLVQQGGNHAIYIESMNPGTTFGHGKEQMTDSLAVYNLFARLDPTLNDGSQASLDKITAILKAESNVGANSLEATVSDLGKLFNVSNTIFTSNEFDNNRDALYISLNGIGAAIASNGGNFTLRDLTAFTANQIISVAQDNIAYRYALQELNPFVVVGADYTQFNTNGELDLYSVTGRGVTDEWLQDRAAMLSWVIKQNSTDFNEFAALTTLDNRKPDTLFYDTTSNTTIHLGSITTSDDNRTQYRFGGDGTDSILGGNKNDRLYGGGGADTLTGGHGNDYLEGGLGSDTYIYTSGDGTDTLVDVDGLGTIQWDGLTLAGDQGLSPGQWQKLTPTSWLDRARNISYSLTAQPDGSNTLTILRNGERMLVKGWTDGDLGITLGAGTNTVTAPTTSLTLTGDLAPIDQDPATAGIQLGYDSLGNVIVNPSIASPNRADTFYDGTGNDLIQPDGGDDRVYLNRGGNNWVQGGAGADLVTTSATGNNLIEGNGGADLLFSGSGNDILYGADKLDLYDAIAQGETQTAVAGQRNKWGRRRFPENLITSAEDFDSLWGADCFSLLAYPRCSGCSVQSSQGAHCRGGGEVMMIRKKGSCHGSGCD